MIGKEDKDDCKERVTPWRRPSKAWHDLEQFKKYIIHGGSFEFILMKKHIDKAIAIYKEEKRNSNEDEVPIMKLVLIPLDQINVAVDNIKLTSISVTDGSLNKFESMFEDAGFGNKLYLPEIDDYVCLMRFDFVNGETSYFTDLFKTITFSKENILEVCSNLNLKSNILRILDYINDNKLVCSVCRVEPIGGCKERYYRFEGVNVTTHCKHCGTKLLSTGQCPNHYCLIRRL